MTHLNEWHLKMCHFLHMPVSVERILGLELLVHKSGVCICLSDKLLSIKTVCYVNLNITL